MVIICGRKKLMQDIATFIISGKISSGEKDIISNATEETIKI